MGVLLSMQEVDVRIPQFEVSVGAAGRKHLATGREAACHNTGLAHCTASVIDNVRLTHWVRLVINSKVYWECCKIKDLINPGLKCSCVKLMWTRLWSTGLRLI